MAINKQLATLILTEHRFKPIKGDVLILAHQTVFLTPEQAIELVQSQGLTIRSDAVIETDKVTARGSRMGYIADHSFFSLFSDANIHVMDFTPDKNPTIVHDLCEKIPLELINRFDFIYNGSVLDNVFDPVTALENINLMQKAGGVSFHYEGARHFGPAYLSFTPNWFFDYAAVNHFSDCKVFYCTYTDFYEGEWSVFLSNAYVQNENGWQLPTAFTHDDDGVIVVVMEKDENSVAGRRPIQNIYRPDHEQYIKAFIRYSSHQRSYSVIQHNLQLGYDFLGKV